MVCYALSHLHDDNNPFAVPIFILGVAAISRFSDGYVCGIAASVIGVVCVNYMFTYPFWVFDMTLSGYPLTFTVMLLVSVIISTLTTQVKHQQRLMYEVKSESMRANLLRAVSHDIRTPSPPFWAPPPRCWSPRTWTRPPAGTCSWRSTRMPSGWCA